MAGQDNGQKVGFEVEAEEVMAAIRKLHERGGIDGLFGRLSEEASRVDAVPQNAVVSEPLRYSMVIEWSDEDQVFVVSLPEWGNLVHAHGATYEDAVQHGKDLIEGLIAARQESGEPLPRPRMFAGV